MRVIEYRLEGVEGSEPWFSYGLATHGLLVFGATWSISLDALRVCGFPGRGIAILKGAHHSIGDNRMLNIQRRAMGTAMRTRLRQRRAAASIRREAPKGQQRKPEQALREMQGLLKNGVSCTYNQRLSDTVYRTGTNSRPSQHDTGEERGPRE